MVDCELALACLQIIVDGLQKTDQDKCGSDQTPHGPLDITYPKPQDMAEERFLAMLRFEEASQLDTAS
jgi:hypothetical protein